MENGLYILDMNVDVLMSHKTGIKNLMGLVDRVQNAGYFNKDIPNDDIVSQRGTTTKILKYPRGFKTNRKFVLVTSGVSFDYNDPDDPDESSVNQTEEVD
jgi:hypothetical protein